MIAAVNTSTLRLPLLRKTNTWYSVCDGNWNDANTWMSNGLDKKNHISPQPGDNVYINHTVTINNLNPSVFYTVNNIYVAGKLIFGVSTQFTVNGDMQAAGILDMSANNSQLFLSGYNNKIANLINHPTNSYIYYYGSLSQDIVPVTYCNLVLAGRVLVETGNNQYANQISDITCYNLKYAYNSVTGLAYVDHHLNGYSVTVNNNYYFNAWGNVINSVNTGSFLVNGDVTISTGSCTFNFPANYQIEVRGGYGNQGAQAGWNTINPLTIRYTTNNQTIALGANNWRSTSLNNFNHLIDNVTVTVTCTDVNNTASCLNTSGWINGTTSTSKLINKATINYQNAAQPMITGVLDCSTYPNTFNYNGVSTQAITPVNYYNLAVGVTSVANTKNLQANTVVANNFTICPNTTLDTHNYDFLVSGTSTVTAGSITVATIVSSGTLLFTGLLTIGISASLTISGTAVMECRGGIIAANTGAGSTITGNINLTTNNQNITASNTLFVFNSTITIASGIKVTVQPGGGWYIQVNGNINGTDSTSIFDNRCNQLIYMGSAPMSTGKLYCNQAANLFNYALASPQGITAPSDPVNPGYYNLTLGGGASATKTMSADLIVNNALSLGANLVTNNYAVTVVGNTNVNASVGGGYSPVITSNSNLLFVGSVSTGGGHGLILTGTAAVELRGGVVSNNGDINFLNSNVNFTTSNQHINCINSSFYCNNVTITGAITVDTLATNNYPFILYGVMNGTVAGSTFNNNYWLRLTNTTLPMATGVFNYMNTAGSIMEYNFNGSYTLPYTSYHSLIVVGTGIKSAGGDLSLANNLQCNNGKLELSTYNLTVTGNTTVSASGGILSKTGAGSILFGGLFTCSTGSGSSSFSGNPNIEFRGGINFSAGMASFGTGAINFTTNNQIITANGGVSVTFNSVTITGAITISTSSGNDSAFVVNGNMNGTVAGSTFNNNGIFQAGSTATAMVTGVFNYKNTAGSTMIYALSSDYTLPYTTYENLTLQGTGIKTASGNTTINGKLNVAGCRFELSTYNITVNGATLITISGGGITKSGAGSLLFIGNLGGATGAAATDFSGGNPTIECRGGLSFNNFNGNFGTGTLSFTTNNQTILGNTAVTLNNPVIIGSGITITNTNASTTLTGTMSGVNSTSVFDNRSTTLYKNAVAPMATGKLYCNQATNTFIYGLAGNQDITVPSDPISPGYKNLTLNGSGAKRLLGNVSVKGTYTLTSPATLNTNGFTLTNP